MELLNELSIRGRYFYALKCLESTINQLRVESIPESLIQILEEFLSTNKMDDWQEKVEIVLPSQLLNVNDFKICNEVMDINSLKSIQVYYKNQSKLIIDILENLIWLGMSNIYSAYDSRLTMKYLQEIVQQLRGNQIELPKMEDFTSYKIERDNNWGKPFNN